MKWIYLVNSSAEEQNENKSDTEKENNADDLKESDIPQKIFLKKQKIMKMLIEEETKTANRKEFPSQEIFKEIETKQTV